MKNGKFSIGFITDGLSSRGGMERYSSFMVGSYMRHPEVSRVTVITLKHTKNDPSEAKVYNEIISGRYGPKTQISVFWASMKHLRSVDVIHCAIETFGPGAALAALIMRKPFFITLAGTYSVPPKGYSLRAIVKREMIRFMYRNAAQILTMSERNTRLINEVMTVKNWTFTPNGVDIAYFPMRDMSKPLEEQFVMTVGDLKPRKGADTTIEAVGLLKDRFPNLKYKIIGSNTKFPNFVNKLHTLAKSTGLNERVEFLGRVEDDELRRLYQTCTAFVLAARNDNGSFEGFPMVFYEAHACGAPVVSTYGFGSEYVIENGRNGFLVHENDPKALAEAIAKIADNDVLRKSMSENSRKEAEKHTWDMIAQKYYIDIFKSYLSKK